MILETIEAVVQWSGAAAIVALCVVVFIGFARGRRRVQGRASGSGLRFLRLPFWAYILMILAYAGLCYLLWRPILPTLSLTLRTIALALGALLYFPGIAWILWARQSLGGMYNISLTSGAQLYAGHRLVTRGPFAIVRHPMYVGAIVGVLGALLLYRTWTVVFILAHCVVFVIRSRREEAALAAEFGAKWEEYRRRVPGWFPRLGRNKETRP